VGSGVYDVFVSYSRLDWRHAADIDSVLRAKALKPFFDRRNLLPGLPWVRALEEAIGACKSAIVLIGPRGFGNTQQYERDLALFRQTREPSFPVVPVILPGAQIDRPFNFLQILTWIDFSHVSKVSDAPEVLEHLLAAIDGSIAPHEAARETICPYRGLDAFREEDSTFFFGRGSVEEQESPIGQLVGKVHEYPFVMVIGRSGSGKSSLVYAGLLPSLRRERDQFWNVLSLRPGPTPLRALAAAFNPRSDGQGAAEYAAKIGEEADKLLTGDPELLCHMIRQELEQAEGNPDRLLLYVDQWEELYAQAAAPADKGERTDVNRFIDLLLTASQSSPVSVVATVRADFFDPLIGNPKIRALLPAQQVLIGSMSRSELQSTIVEPAKKVGLAFDPAALVQHILDEAGEDEGMLPLLQYALKETWAYRQGNVMTGDSYARSGGVREAIRITAERTFDALSPGDQQAARKLFLRLVVPGEGQEDTRARAAMPKEEALRKIVEQFAGPRTRLLVTGWDRAARPTVEVAHEALIRTWPRLRGWIGANREKLRARTAILQAKAEWKQNSRRDDMLLPGGLQLERARNLLADPGDIGTDDIKEFISLSSARDAVALKQVERRKFRTRTIALVSLTLFAVFMGFLAWKAEEMNVDMLTGVRWRLFGQRYDPAKSPTVLIGLDEESFRTPPFKGSPTALWTREVGRVLSAALEGGARVVGVDVVWPASIEQWEIPFGEQTVGARLRGFDGDFRRTLIQAGRAHKLVLGAILLRERSVLPEWGQIRAVGGEDNIRSLNVSAGNDEVVRRVPLAILVDNRPVPGFAVELAARAIGAQPQFADDRSMTLSGYHVPAVVPNTLTVNFEGGSQDIPTYSLADLRACLERGDEKSKEFFKRSFDGKVVIIGAVLNDEDRKVTSKRFATAPEGPSAERCALPPPPSRDFSSPDIPGAYIHATAVNNLIRQDALIETGPIATLGIAAAFAAASAFAALLLPPIAAVATFLALAAAWTAATLAAFRHTLVLPLVGPILVGLAALVITIVYRRVIRAREGLFLPRPVGSLHQ
jgi:CHASE2 domain-containing sensor protein